MNRKMSEIQRTLVPSSRIESSDFSIEKILSKNTSSSKASCSTNRILHLPEQIYPSFHNESVVIGSSPSFIVQKKLEWLKKFYKLQSLNPRHRLNVNQSDAVVIKRTEIIKRFNNSDHENFNDEFSWLRCTRYHPPKLPRKSSSGKSVKRKLGSHPRIPFTKYQLEMLSDKYKKNAYLSRKDVVHLTNLLHLPPSRIKIWFQNRRAREKRESQTTQ